MFVWTSVYYVGCKMMICQLYHSLHIYQSVLHSRQDPSFSLSFLPPSVILLFTYYWCGLTDSYFSVLYILLLILNCFITQIVPDFCSGSFFKLDPIFLWHASLFFVVFPCFLELHGFLCLFLLLVLVLFFAHSGIRHFSGKPWSLSQGNGTRDKMALGILVCHCF